jgi:hypothetical protein
MQKGANVTAQDCLGKTPLMIAIMSSNRPAAAVQLEWQFAVGTDLLVKVDSQGLNASQYRNIRRPNNKRKYSKARNCIKNGPTKPRPN